MPESLLFVLTALSVFVVTYVITESEFPVADAFRRLVVRRTGGDSGWTTLLMCPWCCSAYVAAGFVFVLDRWFVGLALPVMWWLGVWGAAAGTAAVTNGD